MMQTTTQGQISKMISKTLILIRTGRLSSSTKSAVMERELSEKGIPSLETRVKLRASGTMKFGEPLRTQTHGLKKILLCLSPQPESLRDIKS